MFKLEVVLEKYKRRVVILGGSCALLPRNSLLRESLYHRLQIDRVPEIPYTIVGYRVHLTREFSYVILKYEVRCNT